MASLEDSAATMEVETLKTAKRRRKKLLYQSLKEQMEFYFSDANLRKDRFLANLMEENEYSYVPLDVFLQFNKIRSQTSKVRDLSKACSLSDFVELNEEKTMVKRKSPIVQKDNVDQCTLYVERLLPTANHTWLRSTFSQFGNIVYISLPRFRTTEKIKGFAFIEFETPLSVIKACKFYREVEKINDDTPEGPKHKRKRGNSENEDGSRKRSRCNTEESESANDVKPIVEEIVAQEKETLQPETESTEPTDGSKKKKKKRKRKKKVKIDRPEETPPLRVMTKNEWKKWKNKYLSMQKEAMLEMKKSLLNENNIPPTLASPLRLQNDQNAKSDNSKKDEKMSAKPFVIELQTGVVVKLKIPSPIEDAPEFRKKLKEMGDVAYVDMGEENNTSVHVRCKDPSATDKFLQNVQSSLNDIEASKLSTEEELKYWEKIHQDREKKSRRNKSKKGNETKPQNKTHQTTLHKIDPERKSNKRKTFDE